MLGIGVSVSKEKGLLKTIVAHTDITLLLTRKKWSLKQQHGSVQRYTVRTCSLSVYSVDMVMLNLFRCTTRDTR